MYVKLANALIIFEPVWKKQRGQQKHNEAHPNSHKFVSRS